MIAIEGADENREEVDIAEFDLSRLAQNLLENSNDLGP